MSPLSGLPFLKMNGLGNEIVVLDLRGTAIRVTPEEARAINADPALKYDQMMVLHDPRTPGTLAYVLIYNNDGTQAGACGNGTRCVACALSREASGPRFAVETVRGVLECETVSELVFTVDMGTPLLKWSEIPTRDAFADTSAIDFRVEAPGAEDLRAASVVNMGNPHVVFFVGDVDAYDLPRIGPMIERDPMFPERVNVSLAQVVSRDHVRMRVWERGAGITQACGSGACAVLVSAARRGLTNRKATVTLPGGDLVIDWRADDHVMLTGPVELEFEARFSPDLFRDVA